MSPQIATVFFLFDLGDPETYSGLLDVIYYQQRTGKWPPLPVEPAPVSIPTAVVSSGEVIPLSISRRVRVKPKLVGWVRPFPDAVNSPAITSIRTINGVFPVLEFKPGWERIEKGWVDSGVLDYVT